MRKEFQAATLILLASIIIGGSTFFSIYPAQAADVRTFTDEFSGSSLDTQEWIEWASSQSVGGGVLNLTNGRHISTRWHRFGKLTIRMRMTNTSRPVSIEMHGYTHDDYNDQVCLAWPDAGRYKSYTYSSGSETWAFYTTTMDTNWHNYTLDWESDRLRVYIDGSLISDLTLTQYINQQPSRIRVKSDASGGQLVQIDYIKYEEDFDVAARSVPSIVKTDPHTTAGWIMNFASYAWFEDNLTLRIDTSPSGSHDETFWMHVPSAYRNYFCEVDIDGTGITDLKFYRADRYLEFNGTVNNAAPSVVRLHLVDPPEWMVNFAYWFGSATGVSLLPLLKIWDRLAKRHKILPYIVMLLGLVFSMFAIWFIWQLISFHAAHIRL